MEAQPYGGDVLEHALNNGIPAAAKRYNVTNEYVRSLVATFVKECEPELDMRCPCHISIAEGCFTMCFICSGPVGYSRFRF
jgi:hypothetical protein